MESIDVFCTLALQVAVPGLQELSADTGGAAFNIEFAPTKLLMERIRGGAAADLAILTAEAADELQAGGPGTVVQRTDLVVSLIGVAVRAGAPRPDITTAESFRQALLDAKSIAYSRAGASGIFFADLIRRLGIEAEVNAKATVIPSGFTGEQVVNGRCEIAIQQVSELLAVPGLDIVGPLPPGLESRAVFTGVVLAGGRNRAAALRALELVASPAAVEVLRFAGLEPLCAQQGAAGT
ncbi:MAG: substrate-binding domain-containing protein [Pseudomonadota bacterium]